MTNFYGESTTFYPNLGGGMFADQYGRDRPGRADAAPAGLRRSPSSTPTTTAGSTCSRPTATSIDARPQFPWTMPLQLARARVGGPADRRLGAGRRAVPAASTSAAASPPATSTTTAGSMPLVVCQNEPLVYLAQPDRAGRATSSTPRSKGRESNRDAVGARVTVRAADRRLGGPCGIGGGSYQSASDPRLHFGLGAATEVDRVEVRWPSGQVDRFFGLLADAAYRLREGNPRPRRSKSFRPR